MAMGRAPVFPASQTNPNKDTLEGDLAFVDSLMVPVSLSAAPDGAGPSGGVSSPSLAAVTGGGRQGFNPALCCCSPHCSADAQSLNLRLAAARL